MRNLGRWGPAAPVVMALALLAAPVSARAGFVMTLEEPGFAPLTVTDGGASDQDGATGRISFLGSYGDFTINTAIIGTSNRSTPGSGVIADLQITNLAVRNNSAGQKSLTVLLGDTNFTFPGGDGSQMILRSSIGGTFLGAGVDDTFTFQSSATTPETANGTVFSSSPQTFSFPGGVQTSFHSDTSTDFTRGSSYALSNSGTFTLSPGGQLNTSGTTSVIGSSGSAIASVPEPGSLALGVIGLLMTWGRLRRGRKAS